MPKKKYFVVMGQGCSGDFSSIGVCSGTFYTCCAISFYNSATHKGGMFHFPANSLEASKPALTAMINEIAPTKVTLMRALRNAAFVHAVMQTSGEDIVAIKKFFDTKRLRLQLENNRGSWIGATE